jgi:hypothetical protein
VSDPSANLVEAGKVSQWLTENGFEHESLGFCKTPSLKLKLRELKYGCRKSKLFL